MNLYPAVKAICQKHDIWIFPGENGSNKQKVNLICFSNAWNGQSPENIRK